MAGISYSAPKAKLRKEAAKNVYAMLRRRKKLCGGSLANQMIIFATIIVVVVVVVIVSFNSAGLK